MQAMQYKISLPVDYDMNIIKDRIQNNGFKTDGFEDLLFKAYIISDKKSGNTGNGYCPLYLWKQTKGMNKFIFKGYFDNIINSFGWQKINIGITAEVELTNDFSQSRYVSEENFSIAEQVRLRDFSFQGAEYKNKTGKVIIYNPDKWRYAAFTFFKDKPAINNQNLYQILHLSLDAGHGQK